MKLLVQGDMVVGRKAGGGEIMGSMLWHWSIDNAAASFSILRERPVQRPEASFLAANPNSTEYRFYLCTNTARHSFPDTNDRRGAHNNVPCISGLRCGSLRGYHRMVVLMPCFL